jgi:outer membrane protein TolC
MIATLTFVVTLARAQALALDRSAQVRTSAATVRQRYAESHRVRSSSLPNATFDYVLNPQASSDNTSIEQRAYTFGLGFNVNAILNQSLSARSAGADLLAAERDYDAAVLQERGHAAQLYFGALAALASERVREESLAGVQSDRRAAQLRHDAGDAPALDVIRADVAVSQARADLARAKAQRDNALDALASETGLPADRFSALAESTSSGVAASRLDPGAASRRALASRPEIASLQAQLDARRADLHLAARSSVPAITANGGYQRGVDTGVPVSGAAATVHVELPLGFPGRDQADVVRAQIDAVQAQLDGQQRTIALDAAAAARDARAADEALAAAISARDEAQRALKAVQTGYREGASSSLDVADARRTYVQAALAELSAEYAREQAYAALEVVVP